MAQSHAQAAVFDAFAGIYGFVQRWPLSTNHKDIGSLYLIFTISVALIGGTLSVIIRFNLMQPGDRLFYNDHQLYNVIITLHGLTMIFFVVMRAALRAHPDNNIPGAMVPRLLFRPVSPQNDRRLPVRGAG